MRKITEEKELSLRHYEATLNSQESDITRGRSELEDLKKHILLHDKEATEIRTRIDHTITRMRETEQEYAQVRDDTSDVMRQNKTLKSELALV
jgi:septal ring factor EnvC (AmiA/AmiB activator)